MSSSASALRCAFCHDQLVEALACGACGTRLHEACWAELGACPSLGCNERVEALPPRRTSLRLFWAGLFAFAVALAGLYYAGPQVVSGYARRHARASWAPRLRLAAARVEARLGRRAEAVRQLESFAVDYLDEDLDWDRVAAQDVSRYWRETGPPRRLVYWLRSPSGPVQRVDSELRGAALLLLAKLLDEQREYFKSHHLYCCLVTFQPPGSSAYEQAWEIYREHLRWQRGARNF